MTGAQTVLLSLALTVLISGLLVAGYLLILLAAAIRHRRRGIAATAAIAALSELVALAAVFVVWFGYAVAHSGKSTDTDMTVLLYTVPPFFIIAAGLVVLGRALQRHLRRPGVATGRVGGNS